MVNAVHFVRVNRHFSTVPRQMLEQFGSLFLLFFGTRNRFRVTQNIQEFFEANNMLINKLWVFRVHAYSKPAHLYEFVSALRIFVCDKWNYQRITEFSYYESKWTGSQMIFSLHSWIRDSNFLNESNTVKQDNDWSIPTIFRSGCLFFTH